MKNINSPYINIAHEPEIKNAAILKNGSKNGYLKSDKTKILPEILVVTSYPPRECGIATYSQDLLKSLKKKFKNSFSLKVCALEIGDNNYDYPLEVIYTLNTNDVNQYSYLAESINLNNNIQLVVVQHEFGLFQNIVENAFEQFLFSLTKPVVIVFHTVLPHPNEKLKEKVAHITATCEAVIVMTENAAQILVNDYQTPISKIEIIPHGTHLVPHSNKETLKEKYDLSGKKIISTFGLLGSGKGIETTLQALPDIIKTTPEVLFLIIGKTHPGVIQSEGEIYRNSLQKTVENLQLHQHVKFINQYLPLQDLLEYLQLTDIYLFTSKDPNQAVSGTFVYAMSCGCPIISTPIPHTRELLQHGTGIIIDFQNSQQLSAAVNRLMTDEPYRNSLSLNSLHQIVPTSWENSAIAHAHILRQVVNQDNALSKLVKDVIPEMNPSDSLNKRIKLQFRLPKINLDHVKNMTTEIGIIQFSIINHPDILSGYTIDDNARALIAMCMNYELSGNQEDIALIRTYLNFIKHCQQPDGNFLNYVDSELKFTDQNFETNLSDSNGRAIWALGLVVSKSKILPKEIITSAKEILERTLPGIENVNSTRAMAFIIKGLYYYNLKQKSSLIISLITTLADRLVQMYRHESEPNWQWYESYLTYANSILPEAILCAWQQTKNPVYKKIAKESFDFLLSLTFKRNRIKVISHNGWLLKGQATAPYGEQPIDVAYTILALSRFYQVFNDPNYLSKMATAFNWFLGNNHLHQIIYNPCTGGCYDGLEQNHVNLNQGSESTLSYLMARLTIKKHFSTRYNSSFPDTKATILPNVRMM